MERRYQTQLSWSQQQRYSNREFLIAEHEALLAEADANNYFVTQESSNEAAFDLKQYFDSADDLVPENRVTIQNLLESSGGEPLYGKFLLCRTVVPPVKIMALTTVVEDPEGEHGIRLSLHNLAKKFGQTYGIVMARCIFKVGAVLAIKNPWFKQTSDGGLTLRCDNPNDLAVLDANNLSINLSGIPWKGNLPSKYI